MLRILTLLAFAGCLAATAAAQQQSAQQSLRHSLAGTQATAVVLDWNTGAELARYGPDVSATPGSVIKPLLLAFALQHGIVKPETEVYCRRELHIGTHDVSCTHPRDQPLLNAEMAIAESCNTWFAALGRRMTGAQLEAALQSTGLPHRDTTGADVDTRQLTTLGMEGVTATPLELAHSYRTLLRKLPTENAVWRGMKDSVAFGMASPARVDGLNLLGKTGTASNPGEAHTHGWFVGALPGRFVIVLYVPRGDGGVAAAMAKRFLLEAAQ